MQQTQWVVIDGECSCLASVMSGVPQDTYCLGPSHPHFINEIADNISLTL